MDKPPAVQKRQVLYKSNSSTPPWKDAYRKRCQDRLKTSRGKFMDRFRECNDLCRDSVNGIANSMVEALMQEEFHRLRLERQEMLDDAFDAEQAQEDQYFSIFKEIREELLREEQQILSEYEAGLSFDEAAMSSSMADQVEEVTCPVCQRDSLHINAGVVFCKCGVRLETEDCFTLKNIRDNLEHGPKLHKPSCPGQAQCNVVGAAGIMNMLMTCTNCDFMHIII